MLFSSLENRMWTCQNYEGLARKKEIFYCCFRCGAFTMCESILVLCEELHFDELWFQFAEVVLQIMWAFMSKH